MADLLTVFKNMQSILAENENSDPRFEADQLIQLVTGKTRLEMGLNAIVEKGKEEKLYSLCQKRKEGYPLQYILGEWRFFDLNLKVGEGVLIPRQDTEDVCLAALKYLENSISPNVLDLCSGTGAIALAIKSRCPGSNVVAVEKYPEAFGYLNENISRTGLCVLPVKADVFNYDYVLEDDTFDMIISNPPYIDPSLEGKLQPEVQREPREALFARDKGLRFYRFITKYYYHAIKDDGYLVFEYGYDQAQRVKDIILSQQYKIIEEIVDTAGNPRGIIAQKLRNISKKILD